MHEFNVKFLTAAALGQQDRFKVDGTKTTYIKHPNISWVQIRLQISEDKY